MDPYRYLLQTDPDPAPDLTPFFSDLKDVKKKKFSYFFLITYPQAQKIHLKYKKCLQIF